MVTTASGQTRSGLTHIYFSLNRGEVSRFHKVSSDEVWNFYQGEGLRLYTWDGTGAPPICTELSVRANQFCSVVAAGTWQAAESMGDVALAGCSVGPGFEFADFELLDPASGDARLLQLMDPSMLRFIRS